MRAPGSETLSDASAMRRFSELLWALASELSEHNRAISELDISQIQQRLVAEHSICAELSCLFPRTENAMRSIERISSEAEAPSETREQLRLLCGNIRAAACELSDVLRAHVALTLRSRRSMRALTNVLSSWWGQSSGAYSGGGNFSAPYGT
jgi:hypothetical protein